MSERWKKMDIAIIEALWRLGEISACEASEIATQALSSGHDGKALRELAWPNDSLNDVAPLFEAAIAEMGGRPTTSHEAGSLIAEDMIHQIANQEVDPFEGAKTIWRIWNLIGRPARLAPFVGLASEYQDGCPRDEVLMSDIINLAKSISQ